MLYWVAFFGLLFWEGKLTALFFCLLLPLFHTICLLFLYSLKGFIDDSDDFFLDLKVKKSTTKSGKQSSNSKYEADFLMSGKVAFIAELIRFWEN